MKTVDLFDVDLFQGSIHSLALRSSTSLSTLYLTVTCFGTRLGDGLLVKLYPYRTLTDKKLQASLGALICISP